MSNSIKLIGQAELAKALQFADRLVDRPEVLQALLNAAENIRNEAVMRAPVRTGGLRSSVVAHRFQNQRAGYPAAFVAIDYRTGPHAHLLEFGTRKMSARPFFRPAIAAGAASMLEEVRKGVAAAIDNFGGWGSI